MQKLKIRQHLKMIYKTTIHNNNFLVYGLVLKIFNEIFKVLKIFSSIEILMILKNVFEFIFIII